MSWTRDPNHGRAMQIAGKHLQPRRLVTSEAVLGETATLLLYRAGHAAARGFLDSLESRGSSLEIVYTDQTLRAEALTIFHKASDQSFSFVDCVSFAIMRRMHIQEAFSFDQHFLRFGFSLLA